MSKPTSWASREESLLLLNAYLDNELDAAAVLDVERRMATDATLKAEYDRLAELKSALATQLSKDRASETLRQRVAAITAYAPPSASSARKISRTYGWRQMAAAAAVSALVTAGGMYASLRDGGGSEVAAMVAGHQRALLAAAPFDVASSDRHTVKPWFDTKLAIAPKVVDLSGEGFPLAGGRIDVVDGKPVPVMVYKRREHVISVVAVPRAGDKDRGEHPNRATLDGYTVLGWDGPDFKYAAVSDLAVDELEQFVAGWRKD